ncbi:MAG: hypothetical protein JWL70_147, partial [Acidimicrobiia bacterium]|nr:hypothetical protein [Acidimicrobiia bacterium]
MQGDRGRAGAVRLISTHDKGAVNPAHSGPADEDSEL